MEKITYTDRRSTRILTFNIFALKYIRRGEVVDMCHIKVKCDISINSSFP